MEDIEMLKEMKLQDLKTGDIIVNRDEEVGIIIAEKKSIVFQDAFSEYYSNYTEDLLAVGGNRGEDIMAVYRDEEDVLEFSEYNLACNPIYERHDNIKWSRKAYCAEKKKLEEEEMKNRLPICYGVIQAYYGNRTGINFTEESVDKLIMGSPNVHFWEVYKKEGKVDRSMIPIPGEEGLVLLYNKYQEEKTLVEKEEWYQKEGYVQKPLAEISELNIKLYSRCLACRVDEENKVASLREEDYEKVMKYLAM